MIIVGEKLNSSIPSVLRAFEARDEKAVKDIAEKQCRGGAEYLDVNAAACMDAELDTLLWVVNTVSDIPGVKFMIDSPSADVVDAALSKLSLSDVIINSVTLESERFDKMMEVVTKHKARIVALPIDDNGIPQEAEERFALSSKLIEKIRAYGIADEDIFLDVLIQTLGTDSLCGAAALETIRLVRREFPKVHITGGLSNVSFGLPKRAVLNGAFLTAAITCGLDSAIMDSANDDLRMTMRAALLANGQDEYCMDYLDCYRDIYGE